MIKRLKVYFVLILVVVVAGCKGKETNIVSGSNAIEGINYIEGTLDEALAKAKEEGKYLFVISTIEDCSACNVFANRLEKDEELIDEIVNDFFFYKCNIMKSENQYLAWAYNSISSPTGFVFSPESELVNIVNPKDEINVSFLRGYETRQENQRPLNNRIGLNKKEGVLLVNEIIKAYKIYKESNSTVLELLQALEVIEESLEKESFFFNNYIAMMISKKIKKDNKYQLYHRKASDINDSYTLRLYKPLMNNLIIN